jgi:hypothetical protein
MSGHPSGPTVVTLSFSGTSTEPNLAVMIVRLHATAVHLRRDASTKVRVDETTPSTCTRMKVKSSFRDR